MDADVAQVWRSTLMSAHEWKLELETDWSAETGPNGAWVRCVETGRVAWMLPVVSPVERRIAAYEKIASDLACELGIQVPPVILHNFVPTDGMPVPCQLTLMCRPNLLEIADVSLIGRPFNGLLQEMLKPLLDSRVLALDSWLRNINRDDERNVVIGFGDRMVPELYYLDFRSSMGFDPANPHHVSKVLFTPSLVPLIDPDQVRRGCDEIAQLPDETIDSIVSRIPDDYLPKSERDLLQSNLKSRKQRLQDAFEKWYPRA